MRNFMNNVQVTGVVVKDGISDFVTRDGKELLGGSLVVRTQDGSEVEVNVITNRYKKDTYEESYFYTYYTKLKENLVTLENADDPTQASVVRITDGEFIDNVFKNANGDTIESNKINCKFINIVESNKVQDTVQQALFSVEGIVTGINDEMVNNMPTGNLIVYLDMIQTNLVDANGNPTFDKTKGKVNPYGIVPIKLKVGKDMAQAFKSAGYYVGCFTKFIGEVINTVEVERVIEQMAFGEPVTKEIKKHIKCYLIKSGSNPTTPETQELTQDVLTMLRNARKAKIDNKLGGSSNGGMQEGVFGSTPVQNPTPATNNGGFTNPFI